MNKELKKLRQQIDTVDDELLTILARRMELVQKVGEFKKKQKMKPLDEKRWREVLESKLKKANDLNISEEFIGELYTLIHEYSLDLQLGKTYDRIYNKLLPKHVNKNFITIGIQGGKGSFNEEAIMYYLAKNNITKYKIEYLHTSQNVLRALHKGGIDQGQFAIHNSVGGIVFESVEAMAQYKFAIVEEFAIIISHTLMMRKDANLHDIKTIMSHPQVFAQCKTTLAQKYPNLKRISGGGDLIDHALVARELSQKKLPVHTATMGSKILAAIYDLQIVEDNLQDVKENYTSFLLVQRE